MADASAIDFARQFYAEVARGQPVGRAYLKARNALAEKGLPGSNEIDLTGDGDFRLDEGLAPGERPGRVEDGMPTRCYLPGADFFCGREEEFRRVVRAIADPGTRGFGLWGMGGIGKTALVKEAAAAERLAVRRGRRRVHGRPRRRRPATTEELLRRALARLDPAARGARPGLRAGLPAHKGPAGGFSSSTVLETLPESEYAALARFVGQMPHNGSHVLLIGPGPGSGPSRR